MPRRKKQNAPELSPQEQINLFMERGKELYDCRVRREGAGLNISLTWEWTAADEELRMEAVEPDDEDLRSFLLVFRKFISQDSPIFLTKIYDICEIHLTDDDTRMRLRKGRQVWNGFQSIANDGIVIEFHNRKLTTMDNVHLWRMTRSPS